MENVIRSQFDGAVKKGSKTKCTGDGKSTGSNSSGHSSSKY